MGRNVRSLHQMLDLLEAKDKQVSWTQSQRRQFWIVQEILRQQRVWLKDGGRCIDDRIVSAVQPHIRPVNSRREGPRFFEVGKHTEFGPKINASVAEGFVRAYRIDFNAFPEAEDLIALVEGYTACFDYYPGVFADQIYWTLKNRKWLRDKNIDIGGVPFGRKPRKTKYQKEKERGKNHSRSEVEGKFGEINGALRYGSSVYSTTSDKGGRNLINRAERQPGKAAASGRRLAVIVILCLLASNTIVVWGEYR